jgi:hypothetical protein
MIGPQERLLWPDAGALEWHLENRFSRSFHALNKPVQHRACKAEIVEMPVTKAFLANSAWGVNWKDLWPRRSLLKQSHPSMQQSCKREVAIKQLEHRCGCRMCDTNRLLLSLTSFGGVANGISK